MHSYEEMYSDDTITLSARDAAKMLREHGIEDLTVLIADGITAPFNGETYAFKAQDVVRWLGY